MLTHVGFVLLGLRVEKKTVSGREIENTFWQTEAILNSPNRENTMKKRISEYETWANSMGEISRLGIKFYYNSRQKSLGFAACEQIDGRLGNYSINLGRQFFSSPSLDIQHEILCHELAHIVCWHIEGNFTDRHGPTWQKIMIKLGFKNPRKSIPQNELNSRNPV